VLRFHLDVVSRLIGEIRKSVHRLQNLQKVPREEFLRDPDKIGSAKYNFIVAVEAAVDLCNHLISQNALRMPRDYADTFEVLQERGVFDETFTRQLKAMVRFRNRLVRLPGS
jgi:uncharacterized protein YutE (UPF0331/DUF86 family)